MHDRVLDAIKYIGSFEMLIENKNTIIENFKEVEEASVVLFGALDKLLEEASRIHEN